mmetsp:Transcript_29993/g.40597  ORF Transcript_29993/g.40597 Transcript_29993/m.40597 type:complete len:332 (+) Transcript_29993:454-1449(+)
MEAQRGLHCAASWHHGVGLEGPRDRAKRVVHRALRLLQHVLVRAAQEDRGGLRGPAALDEDEVVVADPLLDNLVGVAQAAGVEALVTIHVGHGQEDLSASALRDALDVLLVDTAHGHDASVDEVLLREVVDAPCREQHVGASVHDSFDLFLRNVHLLLANPLQLLWVVDDNVHAHRHAMLLQVKVDQRDLRGRHLRRHLLRAAAKLHRVASRDEHGLIGALAVRLQDVDLADRIFRLAIGVDDLDCLDSVHNDLREDIPLHADELRGEGCPRDAVEHVLLQGVHLHTQVLLNVFDALAHGDAVPGNDRRRVDVVLHELVRTLQQLCCNDHH